MGLLGRAVPPWPPSQVHNPTASPPASPGALAVAHRAGTFSLWRASVKNGLVSNGTSFLTSLIRGYWWYHKGGGRQESCFSSLVQLSWELINVEPVPRQPFSLLGSEEVTHIQPQAAPVAWSHQKITNLIFHSSLQIRIARRGTHSSSHPAIASSSYALLLHYGLAWRQRLASCCLQMRPAHEQEFIQPKPAASSVPAHPLATTAANSHEPGALPPPGGLQTLSPSSTPEPYSFSPGSFTGWQFTSAGYILPRLPALRQ